MICIWTVIFLVLLFIEIITVNLVTVWFALGALSAIIVSIFTDNLIIQTLVFIFVSSISLLITKPLVKKLGNKDFVPTNLDRVVGKVGIVTRDITNENYGEVKVLGSIWTACSFENIKKDTKVIVQKIDGVKLIVQRCKEENK